jgi:hypothetical protein
MNFFWCPKMEAFSEPPQALNTLNEWEARLPGFLYLRSLTSGDDRVRIAVLDGPLAIPGEQLAAADHEVVNHGSLVTSIIVNTNPNIETGLAPYCTVENIDIYANKRVESNEKRPQCSQADLASHIQTAIRRQANIINISASELREPLIAVDVLAQAIADAIANDILVIAAVGNQGSSGNSIPASFPGVLAVGAVDTAGKPLSSNNWGPSVRSQGLLAPGLSIPGACAHGGICHGTGSSFATAVVSAIAGLLMSVELNQGKKLDGRRIKQLLLDTADPCDPSTNLSCAPFLAGRLNVAKATNRLTEINKDGPQEEIMQTEQSETDVDRGGEIQMQSFSSPAATTSAEASVRPAGDGLQPAQCGCGGKCSGGPGCTCGIGDKAQLVYAIGSIGLSFGSQARRDSIWRELNVKIGGGERERELKPISTQAIIDLLGNKPFFSESIVWTLSRTEVPMYAISPAGAYAADTFKWLVNELSDTLVDYISVPGIKTGKITLYNGAEVDILVPDLRGMYSWSMAAYTKAIVDKQRNANPKIDEKQLKAGVDRFLGKILFTLRNRGVSPEERALNAAVTEAFHVGELIEEVTNEGLVLKDVSVEKSPLNRIGSLYYDVLLTFFDPQNKSDRALLLARYTIDVSDTIPVMIGIPRTWHEY